MGANPTQASAIVCTLIAFVFMAGAFAGGGFLTLIGALVFLGLATFLFLKCKPLENQTEGEK